MDRLIGILRTPTHLAALVSTRCGMHEIAPEALDQYWAADTEASQYGVAERPLGPDTAGLVPVQERLLASWNALAAVRSPDARTVSQVLHVCSSTEPGYASAQALPPLDFSVAAQQTTYQPTASHPRAFRGTKYKPPKAAQPPLIDLRPYLCGQACAALTALQPYAGTAVEELERLTAEALFVQELELPDAFRRMVYPLLRRTGQAVAGELLSLYWALDLDHRPGLLSTVVRLLTFLPNRNAVEWLKTAARQPFEFQTRFLHMLLVTDAYCRDAVGLTPEDHERIDALTGSPFYPYRLYCLLSALAEKTDTRYLASGFKLADASKPDYRCDRGSYKGVFPEETVARLMAHLRGAKATYGWLDLRMWEFCGKLEGLGEFLPSIDWTRYSPDVAYEYVHFYMYFAYQDVPAREAEIKWTFVRDNSLRIEKLMQEIPKPYQLKVIFHLEDFLWFWSEKEPLDKRLERAILLLGRLAGPPFTTRTHTGRVLADAIELLMVPYWDRLASAPDSSFLRLEEACKSENAAKLVGRGMASLLEILPSITVTCFTHSSARLCKLARLLGVHSEAKRSGIVRQWSALPLMNEALSEMPAQALCDVLSEQLNEEASAIIPQKLQDHLSGKRSLASESLAHYDRQLRKQLCQAQLETIEADLFRSLQEGFPAYAEHEPVRHALQMVRGLRDNRRALRKFLKAYFAGDTGYLLKHPLTRAWLRKHPAVPAAAWLNGVLFTKHTEQWGAIRIELETDPLEVLKLGAYVGSCLSLGGLCDYSAAAALLDINKQVLYARDSKGTVRARQLVAISEEEELVCFSVYPQPAGPELVQMFHEYDGLFADALGLKIYSMEDEGDYTIECILSENWWDDGAWCYWDEEP